MSTTDEQADRLERLERKVDTVLAKLEQFEQAASSFLTGSAISKMFAGIRAGKD